MAIKHLNFQPYLTRESRQNCISYSHFTLLPKDMEIEDKPVNPLAHYLVPFAPFVCILFCYSGLFSEMASNSNCTEQFTHTNHPFKEQSNSMNTFIKTKDSFCFEKMLNIFLTRVKLLNVNVQSSQMLTLTVSLNLYKKSMQIQARNCFLQVSRLLKNSESEFL